MGHPLGPFVPVLPWIALAEAADRVLRPTMSLAVFTSDRVRERYIFRVREVYAVNGKGPSEASLTVSLNSVNFVS